MKSIPHTLLIFLLLFTINLSCAQDDGESLSKEYKEEVINNLSVLMNQYYVFPDIAGDTEKHLWSQLKEGHFDQCKDDESFAAALTESVQEVNKDKHMRIRPSRPYVAPDNSQERLIEARLDRIDRSRRSNAGFNTVQIMEGNVGYLDLRGFAGLMNGKEVTDSYMKLMSRSDAVIIDLSKNGGGSPGMVQYLCSFFFDEHVHLNSLYWREGDETQEFWTLDEVGGMKMPDVPLFVITSGRTFSGAEEFAYNMQTQKRATLVGQTSGGGANPGRTMRINDNLNVFIPTGRAINPITKTNWEGVGVVPEVATEEDKALEMTLELAQDAAEEFRTKRKAAYTELLTGLYSQLEQYTAGQSEAAILESLSNCMEHNVLGEGDINQLGYEYLIEHEKVKIAEAIFLANTKLYPNSANVYDSYAEALMMNGELEASMKNYQKAVTVATENEDPNLELFQNNLKRVKKEIENKK